MVQYARVALKSARLSEEFGASYATRLFGARAVAKLPRVTRGKNVGQPKGTLMWEKASVGGWYRDGAFSRVVYPGFVRAWIQIDGRKVLETNYPCFEKKVAAEEEHWLQNNQQKARTFLDWIEGHEGQLAYEPEGPVADRLRYWIGFYWGRLAEMSTW